MNLWVFSHCRNEAHLARWFTSHYAQFADRIIVFDDGSTDGTPDLLRLEPKCEVRPIQMGGLQEDELLQLAAQVYPESRGEADYIMWPDMDELVYHPRLKDALLEHQKLGHDVVRTLGFNMMGADIPAYEDGAQLTDRFRTGVRAPVYSKSIIINPAKNITWSRGKHFIISNGVTVSPEWDEYQPHVLRPKLLHYRYTTPEYTRARNARQFERSVDKNAAWSNHPERTGEHTPEWVARTMPLARDVVCDEACYLHGKLDA